MELTQLKLQAKNMIQTQTTEFLKEVLFKLNDNLSVGANFAFDEVLNELENRLEENKFIELCESL